MSGNLLLAQNESLTVRERWTMRGARACRVVRTEAVTAGVTHDACRYAVETFPRCVGADIRPDQLPWYRLLFSRACSPEFSERISSL
jgi:hypothetical protein